MPGRDTVSLQAIEYYSRLPDGVTVDRIFILDPMVATGGTAIAALKMMREWGLAMDKVSFLGIIASQSAVDSIVKAFPQVDVSALRRNVGSLEYEADLGYSSTLRPSTRS